MKVYLPGFLTHQYIYQYCLLGQVFKVSLDFRTKGAAWAWVDQKEMLLLEESEGIEVEGWF